jgi:hypothetical protein
MPFQAGQPRPPNPGRRKGIPNKITSDLRSRIQKADPLAGLLPLAEDSNTSSKLKARVLLELLGYTLPKPVRRVAVELPKLDLAGAVGVHGRGRWTR